MASKRQLKKQLNKLVYDVVDECYSVQLWNPSKAKASEKIIDKADKFLLNTIQKINAAKSKTEFPPICKEIEENAESLYNDLSKL